jgi:predicted nucleotidyltransferase
MRSDTPPCPHPLVRLPSLLDPLRDQVQAWAQPVCAVRRVYLFGSTLRLKPYPRDLDLAMELDVPDTEFIRASTGVQSTWAQELGEIIGRKVNVQFSHPTFPVVWGALQKDGCAILFERVSNVIKLRSMRRIEL